jgi:hypothetical protein
MRRSWCAPLILLLLGLVGCQTTREPRPPRPPEELRKPSDEARYQTPNFYPNHVLNQDNTLKARDSGDPKSPGMMNRRGMGGMGGMGGP